MWHSVFATAQGQGIPGRNSLKCIPPGNPVECGETPVYLQSDSNPRKQIPLLPLPLCLSGSSPAQSGLSSPLSSEPSVKSSQVLFFCPWRIWATAINFSTFRIYVSPLAITSLPVCVLISPGLTLQDRWESRDTVPYAKSMMVLLFQTARDIGTVCPFPIKEAAFCII